MHDAWFVFFSHLQWPALTPHSSLENTPLHLYLQLCLKNHGFNSILSGSLRRRGFSWTVVERGGPTPSADIQSTFIWTGLESGLEGHIKRPVAGYLASQERTESYSDVTVEMMNNGQVKATYCIPGIMGLFTDVVWRNSFGLLTASSLFFPSGNVVSASEVKCLVCKQV